MPDNESPIFEIISTEVFDKWLKKLKNAQAKNAILARISRIEIEGFFGDVEPVGEGISELRFHIGAGYRVYYLQKGDTVILLLCGGDKDTQQADIVKAKKIAKELNNEN